MYAPNSQGRYALGSGPVETDGRIVVSVKLNAVVPPFAHVTDADPDTDDP
jgi:hypothetical protein